MSTADVLTVTAARDLLERARKERGLLHTGDPLRRFLLGVDAAALEVVHPELAETRGEGWLDQMPHEFRDGYLRTRTAIADARRRGAASIPIPPVGHLG